MTWEASLLDVDGTREWVSWVAALPADWTSDGERLVLVMLACDAFHNESRPGADNLAAWTGMDRRSVQRILRRLVLASPNRPALLIKANNSRGRAASRYQFQPRPTVTVGQSPTATPTATQPRPTVTVNRNPNRDTTAPYGHPPFPSPLSSPLPRVLTSEQQAVANALGMQDDDEKLTSVDQMLKDNGALKPMGWIRSCAKNGDLGRLLDEAHSITQADHWKRAQANTEQDRLWAHIVAHHGQEKAQELYDQCEARLTTSYANGVPRKVLLMDLIQDLPEGKAS